MCSLLVQLMYVTRINLKPGFHMIVQIVPVVSKNVKTIGTIIWKRYPDDRKRDPDCFKIYTIVPIVRIELNSIEAIEVVSVVGVWVAFPYDRPDRLNIFLRRLGRSGRSYGNQALVKGQLSQLIIAAARNLVSMCGEFVILALAQHGLEQEKQLKICSNMFWHLTNFAVSPSYLNKVVMVTIW